MFEQVTIIGVGLLGGSLARACRHRQLTAKIVGFGRNSDTLKKAKAVKIIDEYYVDLAAAVKEADLVVVCTPVGSVVSIVREMIPFLKQGCFITDVGSVKAPVVREIDEIIPDAVYFVGAHPIAGGEQSGFKASDKDLFAKAKCILTPTPKTDAAALERITDFWGRLGSTTLRMDAEEHDTIYGAVSHLPHVIAYALVDTIAELKTENYNEITSFCGNGFKDITRLASSEPVMWKDICLSNKKVVLDFIQRFQDNLDKIKSGIEREEGEFLVKKFTAASEYRLNLSAKE